MQLHESLRINLGCDRPQTLCWGWGAEQRHTRPQQYRNHRNDVLGDKTLCAKAARELTTRGQPRVLTSPTAQLGHHLPGALVGHNDVREGGVQELPREHPARLIRVGRARELGCLLKCLAPHEYRVYGPIKIGVPVILPWGL